MSGGDTGVRLAFYGDDFTGSTDAMEVTAFAGLKTVLFPRVPDADLRARFADYDVIGIAGTSRARDVAWMDAHLPEAFEALSALGAPVVQYKVCSTYDSAPEIGSIGRAVDLGLGVLGGAWSPAIVGAPHLGRWQVFGNLFAVADGAVHRIDRHPSMSRHPVTPMAEADLRRHLSRQTERPVESVDFTALAGFAPDPSRTDRPVVFLDVLDPASQAEAGRIVWEAASGARLFTASSSGLQYALVAHWRRIGLIPETPAPMPAAAPVERLLVLSGSCSPATAAQIERAERAGFATIRIDVTAAADPSRAAAERDRLLGATAAAFETGRGAVLFAAKTTDDPAFARLKADSAARGVPFGDAQHALGTFMGAVAEAAVPRFALRRMLVAGGDTSGRVAGTLPIDALEVAHPLGPGVPICRCHSRDPVYDGLQIALKGGQLGGPDAFVNALG